MTSLKDGDLQHSSALTQSPEGDKEPQPSSQKLIRNRTADRDVMVVPGGMCNTGQTSLRQRPRSLLNLPQNSFSNFSKLRGIPKLEQFGETYGNIATYRY